MTPETNSADWLTLTPELLEAIHRIAATDHLLVALDFDGVMAPLVDRPENARPLPRTAAAFESLTGLERTTTALISGRALDSLRLVASPPAQTLLIGSHGAEAWLGPDSTPLTLDAEQLRLLAEVRATLAEISDAAPGTHLEDKPAGVVLHTRQADDDVAEDAVAAAESVLGNLAGVHLKTGKRVLETSVVHASKGEGISFLRQITDATAVVFAGDDVTDEDAFARLAKDDVSIKVGFGFTQAQYRVEAPVHMAEVLEALLKARQKALGDVPPSDAR